MPELPEVENVRRSLETLVRGERIVRVDIRRRDVIEGDDAIIPHMLVGEAITQILRHGKQLAICGAPTAVGVHLGMTGSVRVFAPDNPDSRVAPDVHTHVVWHLASGARFAFRDPRRFGGVFVFPTLEALAATRWAPLGPDALSITPDQLASAIARAKRPIKATLLDQFVLAGMGNIYVDELLFTLGIHPLTHARKLTRGQVDKLVDSMHALLRRAIDAGGSTLRDYTDARGESGGFQNLHRVYGRGGQPCVQCGALLRSLSLAGRTTVFCPACQRRGKRVD